MDYMSINYFRLNFKLRIVSLYCVIFLKHNISCCTMESTWKFLFDNGESKYKCSFEQIQNNVVYTCEAMFCYTEWIKC